MNPKLKQSAIDMDFAARAQPGMMHLRGSGPAHETCLSCAHFERAETAINEKVGGVWRKKNIPDPPNGYCGKLRAYSKRKPPQIKDFFQACSHWRAKE